MPQELAGYRQALGYVQALGRAAHFQYDLGVLNALNYMMIGHHRDKSPGVLRPGAIFNGRMSRALHTLVLARDQILSPEFSSIEEWLGTGRNTYDYYDALRNVQGGSWKPERKTHSWVRFCLRAHHMQAQQVQQRLAEAADIWLLLEEKIESEKLPSRCVAALYQVSISNRLRRATYQSDESLSPGQATRDLRELARRDWLAPYGETKGRFYAPGPKMKKIRRDFAARRPPLREPY